MSFLFHSTNQRIIAYVKSPSLEAKGVQEAILPRSREISQDLKDECQLARQSIRSK